MSDEIPTEFMQVWAVLGTAYPNHAKENGATAMSMTLRLYWRLLKDVPIDSLQQAALRHIAGSKWFPQIAELRAASFALEAPQQQTAIEAWGEVCEAMSSSDYYCYVDHVTVPHFDNPITNRLVDSMGWRNLCHSEDGTADRARFIQAYDQLAARQSSEGALPSALRIGARYQDVPQLEGVR
jgi:hypothetical protein